MNSNHYAVLRISRVGLERSNRKLTKHWVTQNRWVIQHVDFSAHCSIITVVPKYLEAGDGATTVALRTCPPDHKIICCGAGVYSERRWHPLRHSATIQSDLLRRYRLAVKVDCKNLEDIALASNQTFSNSELTSRRLISSIVHGYEVNRSEISHLEKISCHR
jgi:hypothetical protein